MALLVGGASSIISVIVEAITGKRKIKNIAQARPAGSFEEFSKIFQSTHEDVIENVYYKLQDHLGSEQDKPFQILPNDDMVFLYGFDLREVKEIVFGLADYFEIDIEEAHIYLNARKSLTVRELVCFINSNKL